MQNKFENTIKIKTKIKKTATLYTKLQNNQHLQYVYNYKYIYLISTIHSIESIMIIYNNKKYLHILHFILL